ncbi:CoA-disulfide reductase [Sunxiuqinia elliptica]|uniref:NADPH-dependent 2,4-dienoyl-CoA reductase, sulfur reductase n=1 Tax=Sunxiuqinia elliptica TaxID=655355 RepID=A0A1I2M0W5_9BACT|nr:CoA-disulfide reductase [Sunxiuqinia elliptica]SFF85093.1 NADPH-dependent 2,4-dienoyl-CoA reductase, sulfur reductase [Sunxiuqinia elliptica]
MTKYVIIGGVAGGATAAARLRRLDEHAEIILFERGQNISYANCGLPYYIGGTITEREKLLVQTPESFRARLNVDVRVLQEVTKIDRDAKQVEIQNHTTGETYLESYDKLVVSPGAEPVKPPIPGINDHSIFTLRNVSDTDRIKSFCDDHQPRRAVVVGAGFIGLEMAENLHQLGMNVTIVEMASQVMAPLDYEMAAEVHQHLKTKQVEFYLKDGVNAFTRKGNSLSVQLQSGRELETDMVILSIGVRPETKLVREAGLELAENGGIKVNEYLQTNDPNIYALGDAIAFPHPITGNYVNTYLAGPANKQGRIVADNLVMNNTRKYKGAIATAIAKVFDLTVASTGLSAKALKREGIDYVSNIIHGSSHAGYYPGALPYTLKILFHPENGKLYGAQMIGYKGIDKRIDLIATVLMNNGSIYDLQEIEHAYAPPYSSAKDPVNQAGYVAENILTGRLKNINWVEVSKLHAPQICLLDVRTPSEHQLGHIEGSINVEVDQLRQRLSEIPRDKKIIVYCGVGIRGYFACRILMQNGFEEVYNLSGGYKTYEHTMCKQSNEDIFESSYIAKDDHIYRGKPAEAAPFAEHIKTIEVDACGLQCPGPVLKLKTEIEKLKAGERLIQKASDPGFMKDVQSWCNMTGNKLISIDSKEGIITAVIEKGAEAPAATSNEKTLAANLPTNKTMVVFSDDMDRALASFVIANGAASMGKQVTLFFTFWGLNIIKKTDKPKVDKDLMGKMFGKMMPENAGKLKLSKMNMFGMGSLMMKKRMLAKRVDSIEDMIQTALDNGVKMIACQMSMDVMGVNADELMDGVEIGGVATYLEEAEQANLNLFI